MSKSDSPTSVSALPIGALPPEMDKRALDVYLRLLTVAHELRVREASGEIPLWRDEHVIQTASGWCVQVPVDELWLFSEPPNPAVTRFPVPVPFPHSEATQMLERVLEECKGTRGIALPCAPNPELLQDIEQLLQRVQQTPEEEDLGGDFHG
jgi:hypothetical protein